MRFTMARPEVSCHPETLLPGARTVVSAALCYYAPAPPAGAGRGPASALHVARRLRGAPREARRARPPARRRLPRARRREPARRPRGRRAGRDRLLRQEHDADHAPPRLVGRARDARHRRRDRGEPAARPGLRRVPAVHRRVPDRRARRARDARRDALPLVLDAGAGADTRGVPRGARLDGLRLRHLPGRLPLEPRRSRSAGAATSRRTAAARRSRSPSGSRATARSSSAATTGCTCRRTTRATCAGTRSSRSATAAGPRMLRSPSRTRTGTTRCCASTPSGRSQRLGGSGERDLRAARCRAERWLAWVRARRGPVRRLPGCDHHRLSVRPRGAGPGSRPASSRSGRLSIWWLAQRDLPPRALARLGFAALAFDFLIVSSFVLALTFVRATPIRQVLILVLIEAAFRYGLAAASASSWPACRR